MLQCIHFRFGREPIAQLRKISAHKTQFDPCTLPRNEVVLILFTAEPNLSRSQFPHTTACRGRFLAQNQRYAELPFHWKVTLEFHFYFARSFVRRIHFSTTTPTNTQRPQDFYIFPRGNQSVIFLPQAPTCRIFSTNISHFQFFAPNFT